MRYKEGATTEQWRAVSEQQQVALQVFTKLRALDSRIRLLGGAPRDWSVGRTAKDLDFFIETSLWRNMESCLRSILGVEQFRELGDDLPEEYMSEYISSVYEFEYSGETVQIITTRIPVREVIDKFPCNASKIGATLALGAFARPQNSEGVPLCALIGEPDAELFVHENKLIFNHDARIDYIERMLTKFPEEQGYEWIVKEKPSEQQDSRSTLERARELFTTSATQQTWRWYAGTTSPDDF